MAKRSLVRQRQSLAITFSLWQLKTDCIYLISDYSYVLFSDFFISLSNFLTNLNYNMTKIALIALIPFIITMIMPIYNIYMSFGNPGLGFYDFGVFLFGPWFTFLISWTVYYFINKSNMAVIKKNMTINWLFLISLFFTINAWASIRWAFVLLFELIGF